MFRGIRELRLLFDRGVQLQVSSAVVVAPDGKAADLTADARILDPTLGEIYVDKDPAGNVRSIQIQSEGKPDPEWWVEKDPMAASKVSP
ncbi:MAG TPA: hypothetical protein VMY87_06255 [Armatimonadota bacterium]|nr:hypothetical protein [Armatimonadota bacterium]